MMVAKAIIDINRRAIFSAQSSVFKRQVESKARGTINVDGSAEGISLF